MQNVLRCLNAWLAHNILRKHILLYHTPYFLLSFYYESFKSAHVKKICGLLAGSNFQAASHQGFPKQGLRQYCYHLGRTQWSRRQKVVPLPAPSQGEPSVVQQVLGPAQPRPTSSNKREASLRLRARKRVDFSIVFTWFLRFFQDWRVTLIFHLQ